MPVTKPAIVARDLTFARSGEHLFDNLSFEIPQGAYVAIIGPNGSGKTTLLRILLGLSKPNSGSVELFGLPARDPKARKRIGYVPQRGGTIDENFPATVHEVVSAGRTQVMGFLQPFGPRDKKAINAAFAALDIDKLRERTISSLSGGELQRVLLARALAAEPDILALDEPVDGLDPESRADFYATLRKLRGMGKTILFVTHEVHLMSKEADAAICLRHELVCHGENVCVVTGQALQTLYHANKEDLHHHHGHG